MVVISLDVVQDERGTIAAQKVRCRLVQCNAIRASRQLQVILRLLSGDGLLFERSLDLIERCCLKACLP